MPRYKIRLEEVVAEHVTIYVDADTPEEADEMAAEAAAESNAAREFIEVERRTTLKIEECKDE